MTAQILGSKSPFRHRPIAVLVFSLLAWGCGGSDGGGQSDVDGGGTATVHDGGSASGEAGGQAGTAVAKFCNGLAYESGTPLEFTLEIGTPPIRIVAGSVKCTPPAGQPCLPIPAGNLNVSLYLKDKLVQSRMYTIPAGQGMIFQTNFDNDMVGLEGGVVPASSCAGVDLVVLPGVPPDGGADSR
jgi:hypothetical protein